MCALLDNAFSPHRIKAGFRYDAASRQLILPFKHVDRIDITSVIAAILGPVFKQLIQKPILLFRYRFMPDDI